jgi:hypothetical protein
MDPYATHPEVCIATGPLRGITTAVAVRAVLATILIRMASLLSLTSRKRLPALPTVWNSQLVHALPEGIWVKPQELGSPPWAVDLATGHLQDLPDMLGIDLIQRR